MREPALAAGIDAAHAARLAHEHFGLEAAASPLPGEYDANFRLAASDGREFLLKVLHPERERAWIDLQVRALEHLEGRAPRIPLPHTSPTRTGASVAAAAGPDGLERGLWLLTWLPGTPLAQAAPRSPELLRGLGRLLGELDAALADFTHPAAERELKWDLVRAGWIRDKLHHVAQPERRALVERALALYEAEAVPRLPRLRRSVIHGDANDDNVLVGPPRERPRRVVGLIDFGDMHAGLTAAEPAVAAAYALLHARDPLAAAAHVVAGYHAAFALEDDEIAALFALIVARLAVSVTNSAWGATLAPDDPYVTSSEAPAWAALERLIGVHPRLAHYSLRAACGLPAVPHAAAVERFLRGTPAAPLVGADLREEPCVVFDLSVGSLLLGADPRAVATATLTETLFGGMCGSGVRVGVGRYDEARALYLTDAFAGGARPTDERRTLHLGIDLFVEPGTPLRAPLDGVVHVLANNAAPQDYGPLVILRHVTPDGTPFFTLYGHLDGATLPGLAVGQALQAGQQFARVGAPPGNGDWPPHVHFQLITDLLELDADFPGVAFVSRRALWTSLSPDPNLLLGIPPERFPPPAPTPAETLARRRVRLGRNLSVSYARPLQAVRGFAQYLYDETGRAFLDFYNNVPLVGHGHPRVVQAAQAQLALLNTNTRYLHDNVTRYAERLTARLPEPLRVCFFVNSGSEAVDLALRLARTHTRRDDVVVLEHGYHGHTSALVDVSAYKFAGPGGAGRRPWVHVAPLPDDFRGRYRRDDPQAGAKYAGHVAEICRALRARGGGPAAFLAETLPSVAGQIVFPPGYLDAAYRHVRAAGGVAIADEVQAGFARLGTHFWGFETQGVVPDIVTLGKPIGNGFPLAAVVTTPEIAASFDNGMEFFSTFGGNPVACAAGLAVLEVLDDERLMERARRVGTYLVERLREVQARHALVGDVRGAGLFLGVELVRDRSTLAPATDEAAWVVERLRERGVLTGTDGPHENVLKLRPPLIVSERDADLFVAAFEETLSEDGARALDA